MLLPSLRVGLLRINPLAYSFISGVFVSISANLFTGVFGGDTVPVRATQVLVASALALLASCTWMYAGYLVGESSRSIDRAIKGLNRIKIDAERVFAEGDRHTPFAVLAALIFSSASLVLLVPSVELKGSAPNGTAQSNGPSVPTSSPSKGSR